MTAPNSLTCLSRTAFVIALSSLMIPSQMLAQSSALYCVPPLLPSLPADNASRIEYREILSAEYSDYFDAAGDYLSCLNNAASTTRSDIQRAIEEFQELLNLVQK